MKINDLSILESKEVIQTSDNFKTTVGNIIKAVLDFTTLENIEEIRLFGSCLNPPKEKLVLGKSHFFGLFNDPNWIQYTYPTDIDILILTQASTMARKIPVKCMGEVVKYSDQSCGYGFELWGHGSRSDKLHFLVVSKSEWLSNLDKRDPTTIEIESKSRILYRTCSNV